MGTKRSVGFHVMKFAVAANDLAFDSVVKRHYNGEKILLGKIGPFSGPILEPKRTFSLLPLNSPALSEERP